MKNDVRLEKAPWKYVWFCLISIVWLHCSHKTEKFWFWKSLEYLTSDLTSDVNTSHGKMSGFVSFSFFAFTLVIKLKNFDFENKWNTLIFFYKKDFFFLSGFSSQTLTIHRTAGEGRGPSFIPLYHFHPLTNIETFICNFACEMTITYF